MSLTPAQSVAAFLADPIGHYFLGRRHLVFAHSPQFIGYASWGRPDVDDVRELLQLCTFGLSLPTSDRHAFLVDLRELEFVDIGTFSLFVDYTRRHGKRLGEVIKRQAQLKPPGLVGAVISGFSRIARLPYEESVFDEPEEALGWLGVDQATGLAVLKQVNEIREASLVSHDVIHRLRGELEIAGPVPLTAAARKLGLSPRTLQRSLRQSGTSYRNEIASFRIRRSSTLLENDERPLKWISAEVGFSSLEHFTRAFRRATGETPSDFRGRLRAMRAS